MNVHMYLRRCNITFQHCFLLPETFSTISVRCSLALAGFVCCFCCHFSIQKRQLGRVLQEHGANSLCHYHYYRPPPHHVVVATTIKPYSKVVRTRREKTHHTARGLVKFVSMFECNPKPKRRQRSTPLYLVFFILFLW